MLLSTTAATTIYYLLVALQHTGRKKVVSSPLLFYVCTYLLRSLRLIVTYNIYLLVLQSNDGKFDIVGKYYFSALSTNG